jgi:peptidoglycan/xylan/chitin deacetylase (PgdA/CDA1 family)
LSAAGPILVDERVPATFFVNTDRLTTEHETWQDAVERILLGEGDLPQAFEVAMRGRRLRLDTATREQRAAARAALVDAMVPATVAERQRALTALAQWSGLPLFPRPNRRVLLADEIVALSRMPGCEIGSHSTHHLLLPQHPAEVQRAELRASKDQLEALLDRPVLSFAYPFGAHDDALADAARRTPYLLSVTVEPGLVTPATDSMRLPRLEVADGDESAFAETIRNAFEDSRGGASAARPTVSAPPLSVRSDGGSDAVKDSHDAPPLATTAMVAETPGRRHEACSELAFGLTL